MSRFLVAVAAAAVISATSAVAHASLDVDGTVFADLNGDGLLSPGEPTVPNAIVVFESTLFTKADANGHFHMTVPGFGTIWVRTPDGYTPTPVYRTLVAPDGTALTGQDLGLTLHATHLPLTFVHGSDTHLGLTDATQAAAALRQATAIDPEPDFIVVTGDLSDTSADSELDQLLNAIQVGLTVPFVPVVGNHDYYDYGAAYRRHFGPLQYSFDAGGAHFIVLSYGVSDANQLQFITKDLLYTAPGTPVIAFVHVPPNKAMLGALGAVGVSYLLTGHNHENQVIDGANALTEINTETLIMGGSDFTPAGYRVLTLGDNKQLAIDHYSIVDAPIAALSIPSVGNCVPEGTVAVTATVELGAPVRTVTLAVDGADPIALAPSGPWTYSGLVELHGGGDHAWQLAAEATSARVPGAQASGVLCVGEPNRKVIQDELPDWTQLAGNEHHVGSVAAPVTPPLEVRWTRSLGAHVRGGSPVLAADRLFVPLEDLADRTLGGITAIDARTGATLWEDREGLAVHNSPAADGSYVVFVAGDGIVYCDDARTGARIWQRDLGSDDPDPQFVPASPTIADGLVYAGTKRNFGALELATGAPIWITSPAPDAPGPQTYTSPAKDGDVLIDGFGFNGDALIGWDAYSGAPLWRVGLPNYLAVQVSPVIDHGLVMTVNVDSTVSAYDLKSGATVWSRNIYETTDLDWGYGVLATPAIASGRLFVATPKKFLYALDAGNGAELWRVEAGLSLLHAVKYKVEGEEPFLSSPVVTGDTVWIGGADGVLRAIDALTGTVIWTMDLGVPILSAPVPSGNYLFLATYDGTLRALGPVENHETLSGSGACAVATGTGTGTGAGLVVLVLLATATLGRRRHDVPMSRVQ